MQFDQIPQSLCSPFQLFSAVAQPVVAALYSSFFSSQQPGTTSGQTSSGATQNSFGRQVCAVRSDFLLSAPLQQNATQMPVSTQSGSAFQLQNFSGNTRFALSVATAVFPSGTSLRQMKTLSHRLQPQLDWQNSATAPTKWPMTISAPERRIAAATLMAGNGSSAVKGRISTPDQFRLQSKHSGTCENVAAQNCEKIQLYQIDECVLDRVERRIPDGLGCLGQQQTKVLLYERSRSLAASFKPVMLGCLNRALMFPCTISACFAEGFGSAVGTSAVAASTNITLCQLSDVNYQRQLFAAALAWCWPIVAVTRHQVAAKPALDVRKIQNSGRQQQKSAGRTNYFLEASHCFDLKKIRLLEVSEIIFKFLKKIPKVIQNAADSLNKGNCNCSDLVLKVSLSQ